jgi:hypothetical protein
MGTTVVRLVETKVRKQQERHPFPSKAVIAALKSRVPAVRTICKRTLINHIRRA